MIQIERLTKSYGSKVALADLDLSVQPGEILGFLGPNGAGKSTTVKILTGLIPPDRGRAVVAGYDIATHAIEAKRRIGYVPEAPKVYESLTADAFLDIIGALYHLDPVTARARRTDLLELFELTDARHQRLREYSKGMRQKVVITAALMHRPDVLILDEPFDGVDANTTLVLKSLLKEMAAQGKTIRDPFLTHRGGFSQLALFILPLSIRDVLMTSGEYQASWLFFSTPADRVKLVAAARDGLALCLLPALAAMAAGFYIYSFGHVGHAVTHAVVGGVAAYVALQVGVIVNPTLPFSRPVGFQGRGLMPGMLTSLPMMVAGVTVAKLFQFAFYGGPVPVLAGLALLGFLIAGLNRLTRRRMAARTRALAYDG